MWTGGTRFMLEPSPMKPKTHSNNNSAAPVPGDAGLREQIKRRAHEIWLANGCCHGDNIRHWLAAEREVLGQIQRQPRKRS
jgi:hypothetical protein